VSGDDRDAKALVVGLIDSTGLVALDLGSLADGGAMQQLGGLSAVELHFIRRIVR
jgi:predicted dinucleotide-binding enzyme